MKYLRSVSPRPLIILCDINIPHMNGLQLRTEIDWDSCSKHKKYSIYFFSTAASDQQISKASDMTAHRFLLKENSFQETRNTLDIISNTGRGRPVADRSLPRSHCKMAHDFNPVLDYANAMVEARQASASGAIANWQEHIDGKTNFSPVILPLAPAKFTGAVYLVTGKSAAPECVDFNSSLQKALGTFVQTVTPNGAGTTPGMLGFMFWASEMPSSRRITTAPPNSCEGGMGAGATVYNIPIPMPALRQQ
jgi:CheY-like chemotaxis protein